MDAKRLREIAGKLQKQRHAYLKEFREKEADLRLIAEDRESELEEMAKGERDERFLSRLDDRAIREIEEIDAALERITAGNYGKCAVCGRVIPLVRLRSLPATRYCVGCAKKSERSVPAPEVRKGHTVELPADLSSLSDSELGDEIHEKLKEDARVDTEELRIMCRRGVIYLYGTLPSEKEHQLLLHILTDVLGLKEVVDRVRVDELLWEREERSKREKAVGTLPWEEPEGTEDIVEMVEEDREFTPPDRPLPEEG